MSWPEMGHWIVYLLFSISLPSSPRDHALLCSGPTPAGLPVSIPALLPCLPPGEPRLGSRMQMDFDPESEASAGRAGGGGKRFPLPLK
ncbi:hypothetical protein E2C01_054659 [Portunus trituberculatus]|uniref:Secreted protein n=1 Tax=Portunus trituberculatus TaxID=210409 RepID=A0A5B7GSL3_PORTR|nr:hypothetical protein [Portunus trituberculatus]